MAVHVREAFSLLFAKMKTKGDKQTKIPKTQGQKQSKNVNQIKAA